MSKYRKGRVNFHNRPGVLWTEIYVDKTWPDNAIDVRQETRQNNREKTLRDKRRNGVTRKHSAHKNQDLWPPLGGLTIYATYAFLSLYCLHLDNCCNLEHELAPQPRYCSA